MLDWRHVRRRASCAAQEGVWGRDGVRDVGRVSLRALTGTRFLAALWVVAYHYALEFRFPSLHGGELHYLLGPHTPLDVLILQGHLAVDFFFLLSGFILAYTYVTADGKVHGGARPFWVARVARIYPVYLLGLALAFWPYILHGVNPHDAASSGVSHLLMLQAWIPSTQAWNQPSWSLSVEAFFYVLFPLLLPLIARRGRRGLWLVFVGAWVLLVLTLLALNEFGSSTDLSSLAGWRSIVRYNPLPSTPEFVAGAALGVLFVRHGASAFPLIRRLTSFGFDVFIAGAAIALAGALMLLFKFGIRSDGIDFAAGATMPLLSVLIVLLAFQRGVIAALLVRPVVVWLGEISYGVYILHDPLWQLLRMFAAAQFQMSTGNPLLIPVYAVLVIGVAGLSFQFLESPLRRAIRAHWGQPKRVPVPVTREQSAVPI